MRLTIELTPDDVRAAMVNTLQNISYIDINSVEAKDLECEHSSDERDGCCGSCVVEELTEQLNKVLPNG